MEGNLPKTAPKVGEEKEVKPKTLPELAEEYSFTRDLQAGSYLDVKDTANAWCLAHVVKVAGEFLRIHFDGWGEKYDEDIRLSSYRLAPLRAHTRGYTGQKMNALRLAMKFEESEVKKMTETTNKLVESGLRSLGVKEFNQFVRGRLYVMTDFLLTNWTAKKEDQKAEAKAVLAFCNSCVKLICKWLELFPKFYAFYTEGLVHDNFYLVSLDHAVPQALPELSDILKLLFGLCKRSEATFAAISKELVEKPATGSSKIPQKKLEEISLQSINIQLFQACKGFELAVKLVKTNPEPGGPALQCPLNLMLDLLEPAAGGLEKIGDESVKPVANDIISLMSEKLSSLSERDIKDFQRPTIDKIANLLDWIKKAKDPESNAKEGICGLVLGIAIQLLKCTYIKKKLLGVSIIKDMLPKSTKERLLLTDKGILNLEWKDHAAFAGEMISRQLPEIFLGENANAEILRKVEDVFKFIVAQGKLDAKHIELLWRCCNDKHEDIMRACLEMLANLVCKVSLALTQDLFARIEKITTYSEILVKFLFQYTFNILSLDLDKEEKQPTGSAKKLKPDAAAPRIYNLDIFWNLLQDTSTAPGKIKDQAMMSLIDILNKRGDLADAYVKKAAECIKNGKIVVRSIQFLKDIDFAEYFMRIDTKKKPCYDLSAMAKESCIIANAIMDCESFHKKIKAELNAKPEKRKDVMNEDFGTGLLFGKQSKLYIDFLEYYCSKGRISLSLEEVAKLWNCYVADGICEQHANLLFTSLMKEPKQGSYECKFTLFNDKVAKAVFNDIFCKGFGTFINKLTPVGFLCLKTYMSWINEKEIYSLQFKSPTEGKAKPILDGYEGLSILWALSFQSESPAIREQAKEYIVSIVDRYCGKCKLKRKEITERALNCALDNITDSSNMQQVKTALIIIDSIISKIECLKIEEVGPAYSTPPLLDFIIIEKGKKPLFVSINENMRLSHLKNLLSNHYRVHKSRIALTGYVNRVEYGDNYDYYLDSFRRVTDNKFIIEFKKLDVPYKETPRYVLANSALFTRMQDLLRTPNEEIVSIVWSLLLSLHVNEECKAKLTKLGTKDDADKGKCVALWEEYLNVSLSKDSPGLAYYLHVLNNMLSSTDPEKAIPDKPIYIVKFLKKGGFEFLLETFAKKKDLLTKKLNLKCLEYCLAITSLILSADIKSSPLLPLDCDSVLWTDSLTIIEWISKDGSSPKANELEIDKESIKELFASCLSLQYTLLQQKPAKYLKQILSKDYIKLFQFCLLKHKIDGVRAKVASFFLEVVTKLPKAAEDNKIIKELVGIFVVDFLEIALGENERSRYYFWLISSFIDGAVEIDYPKVSSKKIVYTLVTHILNRKFYEIKVKDVDYCLNGPMDILRLLLTKNNALKSQIEKPSQFVQGLMNALFLMEKENPKCKCEKSRNAALKLLNTLSLIFHDAEPIMMNMFHSLHTNETWRTNKRVDWNIQSGSGEKSEKYVGLKNLGATCYLNSSLQQFFMIPQFRKKIIEVEHKNNEQSMLFQLQLIFASLKDSNRSTYNPHPFTQCVKMDGKVLDTIEQKDVDEFITTFLDLLERELKPTAQSRLVQDTFKLTMANEIISKECSCRSETKEEAISIILNVKNKKNIYESLNAFVQSDILEGDNAYQCDRCGRKVAAYKRQNIKKLPNVLIIVLKRFEFNVEATAKVKVNDFCEFPSDLNMEEFTQEGQAYKDLTREMEVNKLTQEDLTEPQKKILKRAVPSDYYKYKLKGIIIHCGHADGGHYYSFITDREAKGEAQDKTWYEFNDSIVRGFDPKDIPEEAYGGDEESMFVNGGKKDATKEKIKNAYVLFYERVVQLEGEKLDRYKEEESEIETSEIPKRFEQMKVPAELGELQIPTELQRIISMDNKKFWLTHYLFQQTYLSYMSCFATKSKVVESSDYAAGRLSAYEPGLIPGCESTHFALILLLTTALRAENKSDIPGLLRYVKEACSKNIKLCLWVCHLFSHGTMIQEFLVDCPVDNVRRWTSGLLKTVMKQIYPHEREAIKKAYNNPEIVFTPKLVLKEFGLPESTPKVKNKLQILEKEHGVPFLVLLINAHIQQISSVNEYNCGMLFRVFSNFAQLGPEARKYLNLHSLLGISFEFLFPGTKQNIMMAESLYLHLELKDPVPIGVMTQEQLYVSKKVLLMKRPQQCIFLFELLWRLIQAGAISKLKKSASPDDEPYKHAFNDIEEKYIVGYFREPKNLDYALSSTSEIKASLNFLCKTIAYLAFDNKEYSEFLLDFWKSRIASVECDQLRPYLRVAFIFIQNNDRLVNKPYGVLKYLLEGFKANMHYFRITEMFIDFLIKLARKSEQLLAIFRKGSPADLAQMLDLTESWLKENPYLSHKINGYIFKTNKAMRVPPASSASFEEKYKPLTDSRKSVIRAIKKGTAKLAPEENSDDDMYSSETELKESSQYDIYLVSQNMWITATAVKVTGEVGYFEYILGEEKRTEVLEIESDFIAPPNSMTKNVRWQLANDIDACLHSSPHPH